VGWWTQRLSNWIDIIHMWHCSCDVCWLYWKELYLQLPWWERYNESTTGTLQINIDEAYGILWLLRESIKCVDERHGSRHSTYQWSCFWKSRSLHWVNLCSHRRFDYWILLLLVGVANHTWLHSIHHCWRIPWIPILKRSCRSRRRFRKESQPLDWRCHQQFQDCSIIRTWRISNLIIERSCPACSP